MRRILILASAICLVAFTVRSQTAATPPSNDEAKSACRTLEHMLAIAREGHRNDDAATIARSYNLVRKYVTNPDEDSRRADTYVDFFTSHFPLAIAVGGGFVNDIAQEGTHRTGVFVYDKNGMIQNYHFKANSDAVSSMLKNNGAVVAESAGK